MPTSTTAKPQRSPHVPNDPYIVPREAIYYLLLQRSRYRCQPLYRLFSIVGAGGYYKQRVTRSFIEASRAKMIGRRYQQGIDAILDQVQDEVPTGLRSAIDVGGGIGGLCLGLWRRYASTIEKLYLLDRTEISPTYYTGFRKHAAFYNSLDVGRTFLERNGVPPDVIELIDAGNDPFPAGPIDLVISTVAWGFHFPVDTYVDAVRQALSPDGAVFLNIRKETDGEDVLRRHFDEVRRLDDDQRSYLVVARSPRR